MILLQQYATGIWLLATGGLQLPTAIRFGLRSPDFRLLPLLFIQKIRIGHFITMECPFYIVTEAGNILYLID